MGGKKTRRVGIVALAVVVFMAGTAVGIAITPMSFNPLEPGQGTLSDSTLVIESESLTYSGLDATSIDLTVNNTDTVDHTGDVHVSLVDSGGSVVTSASKTGVSLPGNNTETSVSVAFTATNVTNFQDVEVRIEETG